MRDVAREAGVSFKTVSRVVNGETGVSEPVALRVRTAVELLGYRPDHRARGLRSAPAGTSSIGFVQIDVANPFFSSLHRGIDDVASARGALVLSGSTDGQVAREHSLIEAFVGQRVDGLVVVRSSEDPSPIDAELARGTPVVFVDIEPAGVNADVVRTDHRLGGRMAAEHLLRHGHEHIAYAGDDASVFSAAQRLAGFCEALEAAGIGVEDDLVVDGTRTASEWRAWATGFLAESRATALFSAQNFVTIGAVGALHDLGLHRSVAIVGFDDVSLADVVQPGITVVAQEPRRLGRLAAEQLFRRIDGDTTRPRQLLLPPPLIPRGSGELRPPG